MWLIDGIGEAIRRACSGARRHIYIVAPYIKRPALGSLLESVDEAVALTVITRWRAHELAIGANDVDVWLDIATRPESALLLHPSLHAKVYVSDCEACFVGSANCSSRGLGIGNDRILANRELVNRQSPVDDSLLAKVFLLESECRSVNQDLYEKVAGYVDAMDTTQFERLGSERVEENSVFEELELPVREPLLASLPKCESPVLLLSDLEDIELRAEVLHDRGLLGVEGVTDESDLRTMVRSYLKEHPTVDQLLKYCHEPKWFGEIAAWLHDHVSDCPTPYRKTVKEVAGNLLSWIVWAYPDGYRLERPRHSQCFGSRESDRWVELVGD